MKLLRRPLALKTEDVSFDKLGFGPCRWEVRRRLEKVMETFVEGFNTALYEPDPYQVATILRVDFDAHHRGFAFEGAGMYYALADLLLPWGGRRRLRHAVDGALAPHGFIATVGAGFAVARVPWGLRAMDDFLAELDPMTGWCVPDGYGFHQGLFHPERFVDGQEEAPASFPPYARRLFDSGVGRSLWWSRGAVPERIAETLAGFAPERQAEMWCGLGVACAYACGVEDGVLKRLAELSGRHRGHLISGVFFAARMRYLGGNYSPETQRVSRLWLGMDAQAAAEALTPLVDEIETAMAPSELRSGCYDRLRDLILLRLLPDGWRSHEPLRGEA